MTGRPTGRPSRGAIQAAAVGPHDVAHATSTPASKPGKPAAVKRMKSDFEVNRSTVRIGALVAVGQVPDIGKAQL